MRKLNIASHYQPSKAVLVELEYLTEMATLKQLSNGEERTLLQRIYLGDKTAIPKLIEGKRFAILQTIECYLKYKFSIPKALQSACEALTQLALQDAAYEGKSNFTRFSNWAIHQAVLQHIQERQHYMFVHTMQSENEISGSTTTAILTRQVPFLNKLNRTLKTVEKEIIRRAKELLLIGEQRIVASSQYSPDYEVEAYVDYFLKDKDDPVHTFFTRFNYKIAVTENDFALLEEDDTGTDWRESYMPPLDERYCYLLHDLIDHPKEDFRAKLEDIDRIWLDVTLSDQSSFSIE